MDKVKELLFPLNIQYFADGDGADGQNGNGENKNEDQNSNGNSGAEKTFTQSQVNGMMAKEKNEGRRAMLNALGFSSEEEAKKAVEMLKSYANIGKDDKEINKDDVAKANKDRDESISRAEAAEFKLACYESGVNKDYIDDVLTIARTKMSDDKTFDDVLKEMKKDKKYSLFFGASENNNSGANGTGNQPGHSGSNGSKKEGAGSYGKQLAERLNGNTGKGQEKKSNYF